MKEEIEDYINFTIFEKRLSKNTVNSYKEDLIKYEEYLKSKKITKVDNINTHDIEKYLIYLKDNEYSITSIARKLTTIKNFHNYLFNKQIIKKDVSQTIERPKIKKT